LLGEELASQNFSCKATELSPGENNNRSEHLAQTESELSQVPFATCLVDRRNQILQTSHMSGGTTSELLLVTDGL
jgi:hypothetical protein